MFIMYMYIKSIYVQKISDQESFGVLIKIREMFVFFFNHICSLALRTRLCNLSDILYEGVFDSNCSASQISQIVQLASFGGLTNMGHHKAIV